MEAASPQHAELLDRLFELYAYDFSDLVDLNLSADGRFFAPGSRWDPGRQQAWLLYVDHHPAGFALTSKGSLIDGHAEVWDMNEFFVIRRHRRSGAGMHLAHEVWRARPGLWDVRVIQANHGALAFWQRAISAAAAEAPPPTLAQHPKTGKQEHLFRFRPFEPSQT